MRFVTPFLALLAAVATAQQNAINIPPGGLQVEANTEITITWTNPSSGTVTIKLQQGAGVTPETGITLAAGIPAHDLTATFEIPADEVNASQYNFEIIDDTNPNNVNFSPGFAVIGATGTGISSTASGTASTTLSGLTDSETSTSLPTISASSTNAFATSKTNSASRFTASPTAASATSQENSQPTSITNNNGAGSLKVQGGLLAALVGVIAVF